MAASSYPGSVRERIAQGNPPAVQPATAPRARGAAPGPVGGEQPGVQAPPLLPATHPMRERWEPNAPESGHYRRFRNLVESRVYGDDYDIEGAKRRLSKSRISDREEVMRARGPGFLSEAGRVLGQGVEGLIHGPFSTARDIAYEVDQAQGEFRRNLLGADEATGLGGGVVFDRDPDTNPNVWKPRVRRLSGDEYYGKDGRGGVPTLAEALIPLPDRPETLPGTLAGGVAQFLGLFTLLGQPQAMKKLGGVVYEIGKRVGERAIKSGRAASGVIRAGGADAVAFDAGDPFVGDAVNALVKTYPQLEGPVSDLIKDFTFSTDPDDSRIEKRFMRSVEGFQLGVTAGSLFLVLKGFCAIPREGIRWLHKRTLLGKLGDAYDPKAKATPADTVRHKEIDKLEAERAADDVEPEPGAAPEEPMVPEAEGTPLDQMEARLRAAKDRDPRAARREGRARTIQAIMDKFGVSQLEAEDWYRSKLQERMLPKLMAREADATAEDLSREIDQWEKNFGDTLDELRYGDEPELGKVPRHPILAEMKRQGGVATVRQNESGAWVPTTLASELKKNFGVTPQTHPGLFRNPRRRLKWSASKRAETTPPKGDMDGFDWTDSPLVRGPKDSNGRPVDNNDLYEGISDELAGSPRYTDEQTDLVLERGIARDELRAELDELGIDLETTSNREAVEALHRKHAEAMGPEYPRVEESRAVDASYASSQAVGSSLETTIPEITVTKTGPDKWVDDAGVQYSDANVDALVPPRTADAAPTPRAAAGAGEGRLAGTKVVDESGNPETVYHGTSSARDALELEDRRGIGGIFFTRDRAEAQRRAEFVANRDGGEPRVLEAKVDIKNPSPPGSGLRKERVGQEGETLESYDGYISDSEIAVFDRSQIFEADPAPTPRAADEAAPRPGPHPARPPLTQSPGRLEDRASWELTRPEEGELHGVPASLIRALEIEKGGDKLASGSPKNTPEQVEQLKLAGFLDKAGELTEKGAETLAGRIERFAKFQKAARNGEAVDRGAARDWPLQIARAYRYKRTMKPRGKKKAPGDDPADDLSVDEAKSVSEDILNERRIWDEERGKELMDKVYELTDRRLKHEVNQRANEAVLELFKAGRVTRDRNRPLFEQMAELIASRRVAPESIRQIMVKHNTDWTDFAAIWGTDVSASARQLGALGNLQRAINRGMLSSKDRMQLEAKLADEGVSTAERAEIQKTLDKAGGVLDEKMIEELRGLGIDTDMVKALTTWRRLENIRRGSMVSQISTAMRNGMTQGGNLSVSLMQELFEKSIRSTVNQYGKAKNLIGLDGTAALAHAELIHPIRAMETLLNITGRIRMGADGRWTREQGELGARVWKRDADAGWAPQGPDFSEFDWRHPLRSSKSWQSEGTDFVDHLLSVFPKHRDMLTSSFNADIAEAGIGSGAMAKAEGLVHALNTFNRFQEHVFRRAAFKAELGRQIEMNPVRVSWLSKDERLAMKALRDDAEAWGGVAREEQERITQELLDDGVVYRSLDKLEADGLLGMIAKKQMDNAVNHSLDITWAKQFDPKTEKFVKGVKQRHHLYDSFAGHVVQGVNRFPMFSWVTPFPRFMANSIQWQLNHSPWGLTNAILSQRGRDLMRKGDYSELAEGLTGMTMLYASWELAGSEYATDKGTELRVPDALAETMGLEPGSTIDLRVYNPFLSYYWTGHTLRRHFEGKPPPSYTEIAQVFAGANVRAGLGLYVVDQLIDDLASVGRSTGGVGALAETGAIGGTLFGNLVASYATPLNMLWDGYKSFQQWRGNMEPSKVRDASGLAQSGETGPMPLGYEEPWYEAGPSNFWHAALGQVERRTPFASREVGSYFDRKTGEMAPVRAYPEVELATRSGAPVSYAPGWKLLTGMTFKDPKNMLGKELDRHGFRKDHIVPSSGNKLFDRQVARHFGDLVEFYGLPTFLASETYQRLSDPRKVQMLRDRLLRVREEAVRQAGNENTDLRDLVKRENAPYYKEMFIDGGGWRSEAETGSSGHLDFNQE